MNNHQQNLVATISAVHCLRGFLEVYPFVRNAVNKAFTLDWARGNHDDALYWNKQATVLGRMKLQAERAVEAIPTKAGFPLSIGARTLDHLAAASVYQMAFNLAGDCIDDLVTHHHDFVKAIELEAEFFLSEAVRETLVHEKPNTVATQNAVNDLKDLAQAVIAAATEAAAAPVEAVAA